MAENATVSEEDGITLPTISFSSLALFEEASTINATVLADIELSRFPRSLLTFAAVMTMFILTAGVLGNLLTIVALLRCPRVRNVAAVFIISLCVADLLFCLLVLPFSASRFLHGTWIHGLTLCTLFPFMRYGNIGVSLLSIAMITINRYVMIAHHNLYSRIYRHHWIALMIAFCWLFSYGMQLPTLFGVWGSFGYDKLLGTCSILNDEKGRSSKAALFVTAFVVPCLVIIICYARIFLVVHRSEERMRQHAVGGSNRHSDKEAKKKRNEWRITKMVLAIFLSFLVCYLPITIVKVADKDVNCPGLHVIGYLLLYLSACINPFIYVIMNKQYRQAYRTVLLCRRPRLLSFTHGGPSSHQQPDKFMDQNNSRTMVSQVSIALNPMGSGGMEDLPEVFDERSSS